MHLSARQWRAQQTMLALSGAAVAIPLVYFLPESARWLVQRKRYDEARRVLNRGARLNGRGRLHDQVSLHCIYDAHAEGQSRW